jgi:galactokinase
VKIFLLLNVRKTFDLIAHFAFSALTASRKPLKTPKSRLATEAEAEFTKVNEHFADREENIYGKKSKIERTDGRKLHTLLLFPFHILL